MNILWITKETSIIEVSLGIHKICFLFFSSYEEPGKTTFWSLDISPSRLPTLLPLVPWYLNMKSFRQGEEVLDWKSRPGNVCPSVWAPLGYTISPRVPHKRGCHKRCHYLIEVASSPSFIFVSFFSLSLGSNFRCFFRFFSFRASSQRRMALYFVLINQLPAFTQLFHVVEGWRKNTRWTASYM